MRSGQVQTGTERRGQTRARQRLPGILRGQLSTAFRTIEGRCGATSWHRVGTGGRRPRVLLRASSFHLATPAVRAVGGDCDRVGGATCWPVLRSVGRSLRGERCVRRRGVRRERGPNRLRAFAGRCRTDDRKNERSKRPEASCRSRSARACRACALPLRARDGAAPQCPNALLHQVVQPNAKIYPCVGCIA